VAKKQEAPLRAAPLFGVTVRGRTVGDKAL
jgi:hypothetical protein